MSAARDAESMVAAVRDDPDARIRLAAESYALRGVSPPYRPYRRAVVAFMRWQQARGVLDVGGSPWWRAVNEDLLRDTVEAKLLVEREDAPPSRPTVQRWMDFFRAPSARSWYLAHNGSVVAGYFAHRDLAAAETEAERFFMNVVLVRVLYAHMLVLDARVALGRFAVLGKVFGHPRARGPQTLLAMRNVLPEEYPLTDLSVDRILALESRLGRLLDFGVIGPKAEALYTASAKALDEPRLRDLVRDGLPAYAWPENRHGVWMPQRRRLTAFLEALTGV